MQLLKILPRENSTIIGIPPLFRGNTAFGNIAESDETNEDILHKLRRSAEVQHATKRNIAGIRISRISPPEGRSVNGWVLSQSYLDFFPLKCFSTSTTVSHYSFVYTSLGWGF